MHGNSGNNSSKNHLKLGKKNTGGEEKQNTHFIRTECKRDLFCSIKV